MPGLRRLRYLDIWIVVLCFVWLQPLPKSWRMVKPAGAEPLVNTRLREEAGSKKGTNPPCQLAFMKGERNTTTTRQGVPVQINGKKFMYREKSVVVVCKNMNATDVERLVPHLSLPGCKPGGTNSSTSRSQGHRGRCIELEQQKQQLLEPHQLLEDSEAAGEATSSPGETATACRGESDLCQRFKSSRCGQSDVICQLMHKVQRYLRTHYNITTGAAPPAAKRRPRPVHVNAAAKETKAESKTLAVLLPCREKGSKTTKIWLRRLQQYLYYHYKSGQSKSQFKILTLFSCHARERLAIMERPDLAGILSFEPRPSKASVELKENILDNFDNVTEVNYCDQRSLTTLQLARLGARLSKSGNLNVVYTYSSASASAMKLLANLILQGQVPIAGINAVPPDKESIADAVETAWSTTEAESVLYIGGPPHPDRSCAISELSQMAQIMGSSLTESELSVDLQTDCDCRLWAFQFLKRPAYASTTTSTTTRSTTTRTTTSTSTTTSTTTTTTASTTTTTTTTSTTTFATSSEMFLEDEQESLVVVEQTATRRSWPYKTTPKRRLRPAFSGKTKDPGRVRPIIKPQVKSCADPDHHGDNGLWRTLAIVVSALGLSVVIIAFIVDVASQYKAEKSEMKARLHEIFLPLGLILLYASIALLAPPSNAVLTPTLCGLRRTLPGLGMVAAFVGLILQLVHDLDKNVYIVNPERLNACGLISKRTGLLLLGLGLVGIQVILLSSWMGAQPPRVICTSSGLLECGSMIKMKDYYPMVYSYPALLGLLICGLSGISLKWKTNSGATWNLLALTVTFIAWAVAASVESLNSFDMQANKLPRHSLNLVSTTVTAVMLLACVFLRRTIARMRGLNADNRELELTSNCTIPELSGRRNFSSSGSDFSSSPASSTMPLPDFHQHSHQQHHSHVNRSYTNTYSSCSSFKLPNIIAMPESSAWPDIRRWELQQNGEEILFDEEMEEEEEVVVHNELYVSENEMEEDEIVPIGSGSGEEAEVEVLPRGSTRASSCNRSSLHLGHSSSSTDFTLRVARMEEEEDSSEERQSHISGISQQDRDNKTILLRQAASGISRI